MPSAWLWMGCAAFGALLQGCMGPSLGTSTCPNDGAGVFCTAPKTSAGGSHSAGGSAGAMPAGGSAGSGGAAGSPAAPGEPGAACGDASACHSGVCVAAVCAAPTCSDGIRNSNEVDVDCGGVCNACGNCKMCTQPADCASTQCVTGVCEGSTCMTGASLANGQCINGQLECMSGFIDCDANAATGCEIKPTNGSCMNGGLVCNPGFRNCDNDVTNGCEASLANASNCASGVLTCNALFVDGSLARAINKTALGTVIVAGGGVQTRTWTGTTANGSLDNYAGNYHTCNNWTSTSDSYIGSQGYCDDTAATWSSGAASTACRQNDT